MTASMVLDRGSQGIDAGDALPPGHRGRGDHHECGFPADGDMCREIPVATITETCADGHMELLPACQGHARETAGSAGQFIGTPDMPGVLTCPLCRQDGTVSPLRITVTWDDMRPVVVIQERDS